MGEQRFDFLPQRQVAGTLLLQKRSSFGRVVCQRSVKQSLDLLPAFRRHEVNAQSARRTPGVSATIVEERGWIIREKTMHVTRLR